MTSTTTTQLKWPDRFFEVHREKFWEAYNRAGTGHTYFVIICRESHGYYWDPNSPQWIVHAKIVTTPKGTHIVPMSEADVKVAREWEKRNAGVGDNEFANC